MDDLDRAEAIVYAHMPPTPQFAWPLLAEELGTEVWVKHENHTPTGRSRSVVASSTSIA